MPNWKKVIVSGSSAHLNQITSSANVDLSGNSLLDFNYSAQTAQGNVTASSAAHTIVVTVISKTSSHPYINLGSSSGYTLDGIESPWLNLTEGIYKFDVSDSSVGSHPFRFYFDAGKTQQYTANVDTSESGAVYLTVNKDTPQVLYYQCSSHGYMGFGLSTGMNPLVQDQTGLKTLFSGSAQITHDDTTGFVANEHIDHSGVTLSAGTGLSGGGDITANRSFAIDFTDSDFKANVSGSLSTAHLNSKVPNIVSSSAQLSADISGSLSTSAIVGLGANIVSSSAQLSDDISGSLSAAAVVGLGANIVSSSTQIASDVSGSFKPITDKTGSYATTGSNTFTDDQIITGSLTVTDTIIAQEFKTEFVSASITFSSGSTIFGDTSDDLHRITGSLKISGSFQVDNGTSTVNALTADSVTTSGNISGSSTSTGSFGNIFIPDGGKIEVGNSKDLQIYHNGSHSVIRDRGTGNLILRTSVFQVKNSDDTETMLQANTDGNVSLRHNNNQKFATTSDGVSVTGNVITSGNVSGSSTSTGSFGKLIGDGSSLSNLPSAAITSYGSTGDNRIITSVNSTNVQGEANLTFDGTSLTLSGNLTASGDLSGSESSTGSFGVIEVGGGHFTSASLAAGGGGTFTASGISGSWQGVIGSGSLGLISGSEVSTGSFGVVEVGGGHFTSASLAGGGSGTGFPFSGSAIITGSMFISGSETSLETLGHISGSSTSTASFARFEGDGSGLTGISAAIEVSDEGSSLTSTVSSIDFVGDNIVASTSGNDVTVTLNNTNSTGDAKVINVSSAATTWAVTHSLSTKYPVVTIWDDNDQVIIPESITADSTNTATITFEQAMSGRASFTLGVPTSSYFVSESAQILTTIADSTIDGDLTITGTVTAQEFHSEFVSSSIVFTSGSHKLGDSQDDIHQMTGSLKISGSVSASSYIGVLSQSAQISDEISGSFNAASSSFSTRLTTNESELSNTLVSSSAQIASDISGSLSAAAVVGLGANIVSASAQIASDISGSFNEVSASVSTRLDTLANDVIALSIALG